MRAKFNLSHCRAAGVRTGGWLEVRKPTSKTVQPVHFQREIRRFFSFYGYEFPLLTLTPYRAHFAAKRFQTLAI